MSVEICHQRRTVEAHHLDIALEGRVGVLPNVYKTQLFRGFPPFCGYSLETRIFSEMAEFLMKDYLPITAPYLSHQSYFIV